MKTKEPLFSKAFDRDGHGPEMPPPPGFNVRVSALGAGYAAVVRRAVEEGSLHGHVTAAGELFVSGGELFDLAGPGADQDDPMGGCYVPPDADAAYTPARDLAPE